MIQLCYASRTTSPEYQILNDLRDILSEARNFNSKHAIHGVLYFADGYFFQCLEGDEVAVKHLFEKLTPHHSEQTEPPTLYNVTADEMTRTSLNRMI